MFNKLKILLPMLISILFTVSGYSQSGWKIQANAVTFYKLYFVNSTTGWAVGSQGMILKTTNAGNNWESQKCPTKEELRSIFFIDLNNGWISSRFGTIFKSTNSGYSWSKQTTNTDYDLNSIYFINTMTGWTCGGNSPDHILLESTNGGFDWFSQNVDSNHILFNEVQFLNETTGFLCGNFGSLRGTIFKTTNGGSNWFVNYYDYYSSVRNVHFINNRFIYRIYWWNFRFPDKNY